MRTLKITLLALATSSLVGCASITPTYKTEEGFVVYDITPAPNQKIDREKMMNDITATLQTHASQLRISRSIPPSVLPAEPGRFQLTNPFQGTGLAALAGAQGITLKVAVCENSLMIATTENTGSIQYGEKHNFTICVYQYAKGYSMNIYVTSAEATGGFTPATMGATISKSITGGSLQFISRTINELKATMEKHGKVEEKDKYIPESYRGMFYNKAV